MDPYFLKIPISDIILDEEIYPRERIAKRLLSPQQTISGHLPKMPVLANPVNTDLSRVFTVAQVAGLGDGVKKLATYTVGKPGWKFKPTFESTAF